MDDRNAIVPLCQTIASPSPDSFRCAASYLLNPSLPLTLPVAATTLCFMAVLQALRQCLEHHQLSGGWMTGVGAAIDNGRPSRLSAEPCFFHQPCWARINPCSGQKLGRSQIRDVKVSGDSVAEITNGYEQPPYLLTLKRL